MRNFVRFHRKQIQFFELRERIFRSRKSRAISLFVNIALEFKNLIYPKKKIN